MFDIIGDIHSCYLEFIELLEKLGYKPNDNIYEHPEGRKVVSVGDIMDRGDHPVATFTLIKDMVESNNMLTVRGNHCEKFWKWAKGNGVTLNHGLDKTVRDFESTKYDKGEIIEFFNKVPYYRILDNGKLIIVHASWRDNNIYKDPFDAKSLKGDCLYGPTTGERDHYGLPIRINWAEKRRVNNNSPLIIYGHQMHRDVQALNGAINIDTGCVFGGKLTALRYPEMQFIQVEAKREYEKWIR
jgi:protein phosphatase